MFARWIGALPSRGIIKQGFGSHPMSKYFKNIDYEFRQKTV